MKIGVFKRKSVSKSDPGAKRDPKGRQNASQNGAQTEQKRHQMLRRILDRFWCEKGGWELRIGKGRRHGGPPGESYCRERELMAGDSAGGNPTMRSHADKKKTRCKSYANACGFTKKTKAEKT